jgi:hypothetical protein
MRDLESNYGMLDVAVADQLSSRTVFKYWGDRILSIQKTFDRSEPRGLISWWFDRRNRVQWVTFWIAVTALVLTLVFGLMQSITGILQVYVAYHPPS